jgi:hypothetical protein
MQGIAIASVPTMRHLGNDEPTLLQSTEGYARPVNKTRCRSGFRRQVDAEPSRSCDSADLCRTEDLSMAFCHDSASPYSFRSKANPPQRLDAQVPLSRTHKGGVEKSKCAKRWPNTCRRGSGGEAFEGMHFGRRLYCGSRVSDYSTVATACESAGPRRSCMRRLSPKRQHREIKAQLENGKIR